MAQLNVAHGPQAAIVGIQLFPETLKKVAPNSRSHKFREETPRGAQQTYMSCRTCLCDVAHIQAKEPAEPMICSFDDLVGGGQQIGRHGDTERLRGLEVDR
jgi:hypothetical protein